MRSSRSGLNSKGIFIVIEGIDGSGKATQTELLKNRLEESGRKILTLGVGTLPSRGLRQAE